MKHTTLCLLAAGILAFAPSVHAQVILAVDFGNTVTGSAVESGFQGFVPAGSTNSNTPTNPSQTFGTIPDPQFTVAFPGAAGFRYRSEIADTGSFTYGDLLEDLATNFNRTTYVDSTTRPGSDTFTISGLSANTTYSIRLWSLDRAFNNGTVMHWYNTTGGTGASSVLIGTVTNSTSPIFSSNTDYSTFGTVTSDSSGVIRIGALVQGTGSGQLNGFELSAIPEPSTYALLLTGAGLLVWLRRKARR